jgi:hypothetical protein
MNRFSRALLFGCGLSGGLLAATPLPVGTISDNVGYSQGSNFVGGTYQNLTQRHVSDHPETVLALIFATPW